MYENPKNISAEMMKADLNKYAELKTRLIQSGQLSQMNLYNIANLIREQSGVSFDFIDTSRTDTIIKFKITGEYSGLVTAYLRDVITMWIINTIKSMNCYSEEEKQFICNQPAFFFTMELFPYDKSIIVRF